MNLIGENWCQVRDASLEARDLFARHYSARKNRDCRTGGKFIGPGQYMLLMTADGKAIFAWRKFIDASGQQGVNCSIFRNEGPVRSSLLIEEACALAWLRWPGARLYTYVNPRKIRSTNPGYCFQAAGWRRCGRTKGGLVILERLP